MTKDITQMKVKGVVIFSLNCRSPGCSFAVMSDRLHLFEKLVRIFGYKGVCL